MKYGMDRRIHAPWCSRASELWTRKQPQKGGRSIAGGRRCLRGSEGAVDGIPWQGFVREGTRSSTAAPAAQCRIWRSELCGRECICSEWFGIRSYPTYLALSDVHGTRQEFLGTKDDVSAVADWALMVAREWSWLFARLSLSCSSHQSISAQNF